MKFITQTILFCILLCNPQSVPMVCLFTILTVIWVVSSSGWLTYPELSPLFILAISKRENPQLPPSRNLIVHTIRNVRITYMLDCFLDVALCAWVLAQLPSVAHFLNGLM